MNTTTTTARSRNQREVYYSVLQGMRNPRNPQEVGFRTHGRYETLVEAMREAKMFTLYRVVECRVRKERLA